MRKSARVLVLSFLASLTTVVLGVVSAFMASLALGAATALIVPGTGTPNANSVKDYLQHATRPVYRRRSTHDAAHPPPCNPTAGSTIPRRSCRLASSEIGVPDIRVTHGMFRWARGSRPSTRQLRAADQHALSIVFRLFTGRQRSWPPSSTRSAMTCATGEDRRGGHDRWYREPRWRPVVEAQFHPVRPDPEHHAAPGDARRHRRSEDKIYTVGFQYDPVVYAPLYWGNPIALSECVGRLRNRPRLLPDAQRQRPQRSDRVWVHGG